LTFRNAITPSRRPPSLRRRSEGNTLIGIFIGLLLGLALAAGVAYFVTKSPSPFQQGAKTEAKGELAGRVPGATASEKPRFDFYKILPGTEEAKPAGDRQQNPATPNVAVSAPTTPARDAKSGDRYFLQAGAFQTEADAENQKARLALLGLEAAIQSVALVDKGTLYRVRLGPYDNADEMGRSKLELSKRGIEATVIKNP
jgi:cell division protein FtsN